MSDGPTLRLRSLADIADDFAALDDERDDFRAVIGAIAPRMGIDELRERIEFDDGGFVEATTLPEATTESVPDGRCARYADFQYPDFAFAGDLQEQNPLAEANTQYAGLHLFPTDDVDTSHPHVLDFDVLRDRFQATIDAYDDPDAYAAMTGHFSPAGGEWSILSEGAFFRLESVAFPRSIAPDGDATLLRGANMAFSGLVIMPRSVLSDRALAVVRGEEPEASA